MLGNNSPAAIGRVLAQTAAPSSHTGDLIETTLATVTIPANALGANGRVTIVFGVTQTTAQTLKVKLGGTTLFTIATAATTYELNGAIANRGATNSQRLDFIQVGVSNSSAGGQVGTAAIDTTASVDITITGTLTNAANNITLESLHVILYPKG
jgi:hypothetical protein